MSTQNKNINKFTVLNLLKEGLLQREIAQLLNISQPRISAIAKEFGFIFMRYRARSRPRPQKRYAKKSGYQKYDLKMIDKFLKAGIAQKDIADWFELTAARISQLKNRKTN